MNRYRVSFLDQQTKYTIRQYIVAPLLYILSRLILPIGIIYSSRHLQLKRPIFIVGCSRSGTTLFLDMFIKHNELANWSEAGQVIELQYFSQLIDHVKSE